MLPPLSGLVAAPFTPFSAQGALALETIPRLAALLVKNGVSAAFVCGTTGEGASLTTAERMQVATAWKQSAPAGLKLTVHVGHLSLGESQALARHAQEIGADAIAAIAPSFFKPTGVDELVAWCRELAATAPNLPFYYYHMPAMTGVAISAADFLRRADGRIPSLVGVKFTHEGNLPRPRGAVLPSAGGSRKEPARKGYQSGAVVYRGTMSPASPALAYYAPHGRPPARSGIEVDLCVHGGTSAGVAAALQAARLGLTVAVVESSNHLGGITAAGLGWTDFGNKATVGGIAREFYRETGRHYALAEAWQFEPRVAEGVFAAWIKTIGAPVFFREYLAGVCIEDSRLTALHYESGLAIRARMFIDASYEGDLLAAAGVSFTVGREGNDRYGETINGMQLHEKHQFNYPVDPYRRPGMPSSGLLPGIEDGGDFVPGAGDGRIQAYNFRMCLTDAADNRLPFPRPPGYDRDAYELLARYLQGGWDEVFAKFDRIPGRKTDTNNHGAVSTDFIGGNHAWPRAGHAEREKMFQAHVTYQQGLQWFLSHDPAVPAGIRERYREWGLPRDEFVETGGWPHALYVREARRLLGDYVVTENDCRGLRRCDDPVALGAYGMDSHNCRRLLHHGRLWNEGDVQAAGFPPYPISYRAIIPRRGECANLLVPVCVSASHIAFGSIRMEPVFMMLGQAAATAAAIALEEKCAIQDVSYAGLRGRLLRDGGVLVATDEAARPNEIV